MEKGKISNLIKANAGAKILAILFSIFLWFHVTAQQEEKHKFRIPLIIDNVPDSLIIVNNIPEYVRVTIKGKRSDLLKLRFMGDPKAEINLSNAKNGRINIQISSAMLNIPEEFNPREVTVNDPKILILNLERKISKNVPVKIAFRGKIPDDIIITKSPTIIPDKVTIKGAESIVNGIDFLTTTEVDIRDKRGKVMIEARLNLRGREINVSTESVLLEIRLSKKLERTLPNVPPTILQDEEKTRIDCTPKTVSITIEGPEEIIKDISPEDISIILKLSDSKPGTYVLLPEVIIPSGITEYWLDVDSFEITVYPDSTDGKGSNEEQGF